MEKLKMTVWGNAPDAWTRKGRIFSSSSSNCPLCTYYYSAPLHMSYKTRVSQSEQKCVFNLTFCMFHLKFIKENGRRYKGRFGLILFFSIHVYQILQSSKILHQTATFLQSLYKKPILDTLTVI